MTTELRTRLDGTAVVIRKTGVARAERVVDEFEESIDGMNREELMCCKAGLEDEMASIRSQLEDARAHRLVTNEFADPHWYRRASTALRIKGRLCVRVQNRLSQLRVERQLEHDQRSLSEHEEFIRAAKRVLDDATYHQIWDEVRRSDTHRGQR